MAAEQAATRDRILSAAGELFYNQGIVRSSMEEIAARAGVTKRTLYYHFRSKDDMVQLWLEKLDHTIRQNYRFWLHAVPGPMEVRLRHMFGSLAALASNPRWKGCGFARAANELAGLPGHPGVIAAREHRRRFEAWFAEELRGDGIEPADRLARRVILLLDGAITQALIHHDPDYVLEAGATVADLVRAARRGGERALSPIGAERDGRAGLADGFVASPRRASVSAREEKDLRRVLT